MTETVNEYDAKSIEKYWQEVWKKEKIFSTDINSKKKNYYVLEMFPYPSGRIHMGHVRVYTLGDVLARYKRATGHNVLHPMGWDSFGMPAENAAFENNIHPRDWTNQNIKNMKEQLKSMGISYDWDKEISTCDPEYVKQQQKLFIKFFKANLLYKKEAWANWDPVENTVLANEQVIDGKGWRSGAKVERKLLNQWFLNITKFANELVSDLDSLHSWPENVKIMQKNWVGKSFGAEIKFEIFNNDLAINEKIIKVYTTRPDTIFGASFLAIAPDHKISKLLSHSNNKIKNFVAEWEKTFSNEEMIDKGPKEGILTDLFVINPITKTKLPVYIANYVLSTYGTGAIFGVPAHDDRDYLFAEKYKLPVINVVKPYDSEITNLPYTGPGTIINSDFLNNIDSVKAKEKIIKKLEETNHGTKQTKFRLRDWCASRQRYWGCPIPIIYREDGAVLPVEENELPVLLPDDVDFSIKKGNPLESHPNWKKTICKKTGMSAVRETDTLDTFFDSSWYFLRFIDPLNESAINKDLVHQWAPVHQYVGGIEHAVLHLLYARFFIKALHSIGELNFREPFKGLFCQGMVCHKTYQDSDKKWVYPENVVKKGEDKFFNKENGKEVKELRSEKMSKSKKNIVDPVNIIKKYGADTARFFMLSDSPPDRKLEWTNSGIDGANKFLLKVWRFFNSLPLNSTSYHENYNYTDKKNILLLEKTNYYIDKITKSLDSFQYNVSVALIREYSNVFFSFNLNTTEKEELIAMKFSLTQWIILISPMTPHLAEELWKKIGYNESLVSEQTWPTANLSYINNDDVNIVVQVNGKKRLVLKIPKNLTVEETNNLLMKKEDIKKIVGANKIKKIITVPNKIFSIVI